jgi:hypothetical protein
MQEERRLKLDMFLLHYTVNGKFQKDLKMDDPKTREEYQRIIDECMSEFDGIKKPHVIDPESRKL